MAKYILAQDHGGEVGNGIYVTTETKKNVKLAAKRSLEQLFPEIVDEFDQKDFRPDLLAGPPNVISFRVALGIMKNFEDDPDLLSVSKLVLDNFIKKVEELRPREDANFKLGLRFYIGKESASNYGLAIVPICGPTIPDPATGQINRLLEEESILFTKLGKKYFGLIPSQNKISEHKPELANVVANKDPRDKKLIYFKYEEFFTFYQQVKNLYKDMVLVFGRIDENDNATVIITFLDDEDNPISSSQILEERIITGICFDQGDLMPPPPIGDTGL